MPSHKACLPGRIGPNSGCLGDMPPPPLPAPGQCAASAGLDCGGGETIGTESTTTRNGKKVPLSQGECCNLCLNHTNCTTAVFCEPNAHSVRQWM